MARVGRFVEDTKTAARARAYPERVCRNACIKGGYWVCQESVHEESHGIGPTPIMCRTPLASVKATRRIPAFRTAGIFDSRRAESALAFPDSEPRVRRPGNSVALKQW